MVYLAAGARYLVDYVRKDHVLIICLRAHLLPLLVVAQSDIIAHKRMSHTKQKEVETPLSPII